MHLVVTAEQRDSAGYRAAVYMAAQGIGQACQTRA
jgi:hypothetical protein